eukprot:jgi/Tetstr1/436121/TSEL_024968.t1
MNASKVAEAVAESVTTTPEAVEWVEEEVPLDCAQPASGPCSEETLGCGHPAECPCAEGFVYSAAIGPDAGCIAEYYAVEPLDADASPPEGLSCTLSPGLCSMDYNRCKQSSQCTCPEGYQYTAANGDCVLVAVVAAEPAAEPAAEEDSMSN